MLKTDDDVLVELAEPTPFKISPGPVSVSSQPEALFKSREDPWDVAFTVGAGSFFRSDEAFGASDARAAESSPAHGDLGLLRLCTALDLFCATTEGAVGKKSA